MSDKIKQYLIISLTRNGQWSGMVKAEIDDSEYELVKDKIVRNMIDKHDPPPYGEATYDIEGQLEIEQEIMDVIKKRLKEKIESETKEM